MSGAIRPSLDVPLPVSNTCVNRASEIGFVLSEMKLKLDEDWHPSAGFFFFSFLRPVPFSVCDAMQRYKVCHHWR